MKLKDAVMKSSFEDVYKILLEYDERMYRANKEFIKIGYEQLKSLEPKDTQDDIIIKIDLVKFKDDHDEGYIVSGYDRKEKELCSLLFCNWEDWLGYNIDPDLLKHMSHSEIVGHCFWEMTWDGWTSSEVKAANNQRNLELERRIKEYSAD